MSTHVSGLRTLQCLECLLGSVCGLEHQHGLALLALLPLDRLHCWRIHWKERRNLRVRHGRRQRVSEQLAQMLRLRLHIAQSCMS